MTELTFLGAARTVTGSKYLLQHNGTRVLVDCGLFQGLKQLRLRNWDAPPFRPESIHAVVLTHAHLDHVGYLPRLVAQGYHGRIFCTGGTDARSCGIPPTPSRPTSCSSNRRTAIGNMRPTTMAKRLQR